MHALVHVANSMQRCNINQWDGWTCQYTPPFGSIRTRFGATLICAMLPASTYTLQLQQPYTGLMQQSTVFFNPAQECRPANTCSTTFALPHSAIPLHNRSNIFRSDPLEKTAWANITAQQHFTSAALAEGIRAHAFASKAYKVDDQSGKLGELMRTHFSRKSAHGKRRQDKDAVFVFPLVVVLCGLILFKVEESVYMQQIWFRYVALKGS